MRYIKLFENYSTYYTRISYDDFRDIIRIKYDVGIDDLELNHIKDLLPGCIIKSTNMYSHKFSKMISPIVTINYTEEADDGEKSLQYVIYKLKDEWYGANFSHNNYKNVVVKGKSARIMKTIKHGSYKCDQLEGLIKLIEDTK